MVKAAQHNTLETPVTTVAPKVVVELCEAGRYREAGQLIDGVSKDLPEGLLAHGLVAIQHRDLETAKDYLSAVALGENEFSDRAKVHLAVAYWFAGEASEARALLNDLSDSFEKFLLKAIIEDRPRYTMQILRKAARFEVRPAMQGRLHNQRGLALRKMGELDRAIREYDAAIFRFEQDGSDCVPLVVNNLARVYLEFGEFNRAHTQIDKAMRLLEDDLPHTGKALDEKSRIFLAQKDFAEAKRWSEKAVSVLRTTDRREWLCEALITKAKAQINLKQSCELTLQEAEKICHHLQRQDLLIDVYALQKQIAQDSFERAEKLLIETSLRVYKGSCRAVAEKLGLTHPTISKLAKKYTLKK